MEMKHLLHRPVRLCPVMGPAGRDDVEPRVVAAERSGLQMVDGIAAAAARLPADHELAQMTVAEADASG